jgi:predicted amidohydrolase YtcJ
MEELIKVKSLSSLMQKKLEGTDATIDVIEYSLAAQQLENKLSVLKSLNTTVEGDDEKSMTLNIQGTNKAIKIDLVKLKDAVTFLDNSVEEKNASAEDYMTKVEDIDVSNVTEEEFVELAAKAVGDVKKHDANNKILHKDTFIKIFKYTGDFAKLRS